MEAGLLDMYSVIHKLSTQTSETDLAAQSCHTEVKRFLVFHSEKNKLMSETLLIVDRQTDIIMITMMFHINSAHTAISTFCPISYRTTQAY